MDELFGTRVPQSPQAEQAVIGSMLIDPACIPIVLTDAKPEHFYQKANRDIFETILSMFNFGQTIDPVTIMDRMKERGVYQEGSTEAYIRELITITPTAANVTQYVAIIRDKSLQRDLGKVAGDITQMVNEGLGSADDMLESAERNIYALRRDRTIGGLKPISEIVQTVYNNLNRLAQEGETLPGLPTGLVDLDSRILGLNKGELVLIASRPGMGKTSIAMNIVMNAAKASGKAVAVFSLEMSREQLVSRILSGEARVDNKKLLKGNLSAEEWRKIVMAAAVVGATNILVDDNPTLSVADMNAQCRRVQNLGLVVVDYLQLMGSDTKAESRQVEVSNISRSLKAIAQELKVPLVACAQLSRANEKRGGSGIRPMLSDLRDSGSIEQDADVVMFLHREAYYKRDEQTPDNIAEVIIAKQRNGPLGTVKLAWLGEFTLFDNLANEEM